MRNTIITITGSLIVGGFLGYFASDKKIKVSLGGAVSDKNRSGAITFQTVEQYKAAYDLNPVLFNAQTGKVCKGFKIDKASFDSLKKYSNYKQVYIRMGRKPDGNYTFMILPLDINGDMIQNAPAQQGALDVNYDNLEPCPDKCPVNFGNEHM